MLPLSTLLYKAEVSLDAIESCSFYRSMTKYFIEALLLERIPIIRTHV